VLNTYIRRESADELYKQLCTELVNYSEVVSPRGLGTHELLDVTLELDDPTDRLVMCPARGIDLRYLVGELCFYLGLRTDLKFISHYSKFWNKVSDDGATVNSAYGARIFAQQFEYAMATLAHDSTSRKAVMVIYAPGDARPSNDNPCTMFLQLLIRRGALHCIASMRSNDVWFGLTYDMPFFTLVQEIALVRLRWAYPDLRMGCYRHHATSMHAYDHNWAAVKAVADSRPVTGARMPRLCDYDVEGWFRELLAYEDCHRRGAAWVTQASVTPFQLWCMSALK